MTKRIYENVWHPAGVIIGLACSDNWREWETLFARNITLQRVFTYCYESGDWILPGNCNGKKDIWLQCNTDCKHVMIAEQCDDVSIREGPVAKWIRHLTTNQEIAGSSPARVKFFCSGRYLVATPAAMQDQAMVQSFLAEDDLISRWIKTSQFSASK